MLAWRKASGEASLRDQRGRFVLRHRGQLDLGAQRLAERDSTVSLPSPAAFAADDNSERMPRPRNAQCFQTR